jgi:hypothetical protein
MSKTSRGFIIAVAASAALGLFSASLLATASNGPSGINGGGINTPSQWVPNDSSNTITPNPNTLQVPCANIVGGCAGGGVSTSTSNTFSAPQAFNGITNTGSITSTNIIVTGTFVCNSVNGQYCFPTAAQLSAGATCGTTTGVTEFAACANDIYAVAPSGSIAVLPPSNYTGLWTSEININQNQDPFLFECSPGTFLDYTGTATSSNWNYGMVNINASGYLTHQRGAGFDGCTLDGNLNPSATTTAIAFGGTNGAEGFRFTNGRIVGFGAAFNQGNNTFVPNISGSTILDNGNNFIYSATTNAGENEQLGPNDLWGDGRQDASSTDCIEDLGGTINDIQLVDDSIDDCQVAILGTGANLSEIDVVGGHVENANKIPYIFFQNATTTGQNIITISAGTQILYDATSSAGEFANNGNVMSVNGAILAKLNSATTTALFISNFSGGSANVQNVQNTANGGNAVSNIVTSQVATLQNGGTLITGGQTGSIYAAEYGVTGGVSSSSLVGFDDRGYVGYDNGDTVIGGAKQTQVWSNGSSLNVESGALSATFSSSTIIVGASGAPLCFEGYDTVNSSTKEYLYTASNVLTATTTKPSFCQ